MDVDEEFVAVIEAGPLVCRFCEHPYPEHDDAGGPCTHRVGGWASPATAIRCRCPGFRWITADGPSPTYGAA